MKLNTDVVVMGAGLAGLCAALEAAGRGAEVVVLEKQPAPGGSTVLSAGIVAFAGTDIQIANGVNDSNELLFDDLREVGQLENDEAVVRAYVESQLSTYQWLKQHGVQFSPVVETSSGQSVPRGHMLDPADAVRLLATRCRETGKVRIMVKTAARKLLRDRETGRVTGVVAESAEGPIELHATHGVLLTSGGFCRNPELMHRFAPQYDNAFFIGGDGNVGDGLRMAWSLGADFRDMAYIKGTFGKHPVDTKNNHSCLAVYKGAIAVNQEGKRYVDESISYKLLGDACMVQPFSATYQILDQPIFESGDNRVHIFDFERRLEDGLMIQADTLAQLAQQLEIEAGVLEESVARYNRFVDGGHDEDFGRKNLVHHHGELRRIEQAPFYAYPSTAAVFGTYCGLTVDPTMQVLDVYGEPIAGLFAAGETVGGFHGAAYMTGTALGKAAIFGRIAAQSATSKTN
jgi:fumarate reductase flavoprotein subunit